MSYEFEPRIYSSDYGNMNNGYFLTLVASGGEKMRI